MPEAEDSRDQVVEHNGVDDDEPLPEPFASAPMRDRSRSRSRACSDSQRTPTRSEASAEQRREHLFRDADRFSHEFLRATHAVSERRRRFSILIRRLQHIVFLIGGSGSISWVWGAIVYYVRQCELEDAGVAQEPHDP